MALAHNAADCSQTAAIMFLLRVNLHPLPLSVPLAVGIGQRKFCQVMICHIAFPLHEEKKKNESCVLCSRLITLFPRIKKCNTPTVAIICKESQLIPVRKHNLHHIKPLKALEMVSYCWQIADIFSHHPGAKRLVRDAGWSFLHVKGQSQSEAHPPSLLEPKIYNSAHLTDLLNVSLWFSPPVCIFLRGTEPLYRSDVT